MQPHTLEYDIKRRQSFQEEEIHWLYSDQRQKRASEECHSRFNEDKFIERIERGSRSAWIISSLRFICICSSSHWFTVDYNLIAIRLCLLTEKGIHMCVCVSLLTFLSWRESWVYGSLNDASSLKFCWRYCMFSKMSFRTVCFWLLWYLRLWLQWKDGVFIRIDKVGSEIPELCAFNLMTFLNRRQKNVNFFIDVFLVLNCCRK